MFDLKYSQGNNLERSVAVGYTVDTEGLALVKVLEDGVAKVKPSEYTSGQVFVGFSSSDNQTITDEPRVEFINVPSVAPYTVQLSSTLPFSATGGTTSMSFEISVRNLSTGALLTKVADAVAPAAGQFKLSSVGIVTFAAADAGIEMQVNWRVNLTAQEAKIKYYERAINNTANAYFNTIGVMCGQGQIYTMEYDTAVDWTATTGGMAYAGADGKLVEDATALLPAVGQVIKVPNADSATLGIAFNVNNI